MFHYLSFHSSGGYSSYQMDLCCGMLSRLYTYTQRGMKDKKHDKNQFIIGSNFTGALQKKVPMHTYTHCQHQRLTRQMCKARHKIKREPSQLEKMSKPQTHNSLRIDAVQRFIQGHIHTHTLVHLRSCSEVSEELHQSEVMTFLSPSCKHITSTKLVWRDPTSPSILEGHCY